MKQAKAIFDIIIDPRFTARPSLLDARVNNLRHHGHTRQARALAILAGELGEDAVYEFIKELNTIEELNDAITEMRHALRYAEAYRIPDARIERALAGVMPAHMADRWDCRLEQQELRAE